MNPIDLADLDNFRNGFPHDFFTQLRAEAPVYWHEATEHTPDGEGFWVLSRHAEVVASFRDPVTFSSETGGTRRFGGTFLADMPLAGKMLNMMGDPRHRRIRNLVNKGLTPRVIAKIEPELRRRARAILAVDEILRWTTSSVYKRRTATRDVELAGAKIHAGDKITLWEMSANRDESVFEEPFRFDIARSPNPHVAFGWGVHRCLGAHLAQLEIRIMLEEVLAGWEDIEVAAPPPNGPETIACSA